VWLSVVVSLVPVGLGLLTVCFLPLRQLSTINLKTSNLLVRLRLDALLCSGCVHWRFAPADVKDVGYVIVRSCVFVVLVLWLTPPCCRTTTSRTTVKTTFTVSVVLAYVLRFSFHFDADDECSARA